MSTGYYFMIHIFSFFHLFFIFLFNILLLRKTLYEIQLSESPGGLGNVHDVAGNSGADELNQM